MTTERTYTFKELLDRGDFTADTARESLGFTDDSYWAECIITHYKESGEDKGFDIDHIYWSGFCSQGDGACWVGRVDMDRWMNSEDSKALLEPNEHAILYEIIVENEAICSQYRISHGSSHYYHSNTMRIDGTEAYLDEPLRHGIMAGADPRQLLEALGGVNSMCEKLEDAVLQSAKDYADDIYQALEKEYDYISSDEYLMELCESNDYRFNDDGHLV